MTPFTTRQTDHPFYSHVIIDTRTGKEVAWSTSLSRAELAVRLHNEDAGYEECVELTEVHGDPLLRRVA